MSLIYSFFLVRTYLFLIQHLKQIDVRNGRYLCIWAIHYYFIAFALLLQTKNGNRKGEFLLQDVEALATMAHLSNQSDRPSYAYPRQELERLWKLLLLNQFHDVLPGSSINAVYKDALEHYHG